MRISKTFLTISIVVISFMTVSCGGNDSSIPDMPVYVKRNLNTINCIVEGQYYYLTKAQYASDELGYGGILLVCAFDGNYYAFDLACPVECSSTTRVGEPDDALQCVCPVCGETYDVSYGTGLPTKGISKEGLKRYSVTVSGSTVVIQN